MYWFWFIGWNRFAPWAFHCTGQKCYGQETWRQLKNQEKLHWFCLGSAWLLICLGKEQALLPVAKCSNAEKYVSCGYSGDFGGDKHFFLRKISIDATHWNWKNCFYFLFSLKKSNLLFLPFPAVAASLIFSSDDGSNTCSLKPKGKLISFLPMWTPWSHDTG